jgi:hypothetical protein
VDPSRSKLLWIFIAFGLGGRLGSGLLNGVPNERPAQLSEVGLLAANRAHRDVPLTTATPSNTSFCICHQRHPPF